MKFLKTTCVLAFLGLASLGQAQYASNHVDQAIMVKASTRDYVKFSVDRNYVGGDYFITDRSGVMVAIGKVRNADIEYYPERFDNRELVFNAVNKRKGLSATRRVYLQ